MTAAIEEQCTTTYVVLISWVMQGELREVGIMIDNDSYYFCATLSGILISRF